MRGPDKVHCPTRLEIVREWYESGQPPKKQFAKDKNIARSTLYEWISLYGSDVRSDRRPDEVLAS